jgi:hypothetical protein
MCKFGGGATTVVVARFCLVSLSGTFSCALPLEKVHSLGYLLVMVWLLGIILFVKGYGAWGWLYAYGWVTMV